MKGNHPRFNQLARMFGNIRDGLNLKQKKTVEEFLFSNSTWIVDTIGEMLGKTKRKKGAKSRVRKEGMTKTISRRRTHLRSRTAKAILQLMVMVAWI